MLPFDLCRAAVLVPRLFSGQVPVPIVNDTGEDFPRYQVPAELSGTIEPYFVAASIAGIPFSVVVAAKDAKAHHTGIAMSTGSGVYVTNMRTVELVVGSDWAEAIVIADMLGDDGRHLNVGEMLDASCVVCRSTKHVADFLSICGLWFRPATLSELDRILAAYKNKMLHLLLDKPVDIGTSGA